MKQEGSRGERLQSGIKEGGEKERLKLTAFISHQG
jgi:hypothetical protein